MNAMSAIPLLATMSLPLIGGALGYYDKDTAVMFAAAMGVGYLVLKFVGFALKAFIMGVVGVGALLLATGTPPSAIIGGAIEFAKNTAGSYLWENKPQASEFTEIAKSRIGDVLAEHGITELNDTGKLHIAPDGKLTAVPEESFVKP